MLVVLGIGVPVFNLLVPADHPLHLTAYTVTLLGKYLCYALLAVSIDLVWGYMGILSLGHAAFLRLGRLLLRHVPDASDRDSWCLRRSCVA